MSNIEREQHNFTKLAINVFRATQAEDGIRDPDMSRGLGDVYNRQGIVYGGAV